VGETLDITCDFPYCNHQVHRDFLITLYMGMKLEPTPSELNKVQAVGKYTAEENIGT